MEGSERDAASPAWRLKIRLGSILARDRFGDLAVRAGQAAGLGEAIVGSFADGLDKIASAYPDVGRAEEVVGRKDGNVVGEGVLQYAMQLLAVAGVATKRRREQRRRVCCTGR